jgi:hypothetical protein
MAGERLVKRSGAVYMISYPKPAIWNDLVTDTLKNSPSSTVMGIELWIYQAMEARDYRFVGRSRGTIDENASGTKSRMVDTPGRHESGS